MPKMAQTISDANNSISQKSDLSTQNAEKVTKRDLGENSTENLSHTATEHLEQTDVGTDTK